MIQLIYTAESGVEASILFDATLSEDHVAEAFIPEHPVEEGANVSDHVRPGLNKLSLRVHVTDTPIRRPRALFPDATDFSLEPVVFNFSNQELVEVVHSRLLTKALAAPGSMLALRVGFDEVSIRAGLAQLVVPAVSQPFTQTFALVTRKPVQDFDRVRTVVEALGAHLARGRVFRVLTGLREYQNMVISRMSVPQSLEDGRAATISLDMTEVRFATVQVGEPVRTDPRPERGRGQRDRGGQSAEPERDEPERDESTLFALMRTRTTQ